jgi:hypothetical protein
LARYLELLGIVLQAVGVALIFLDFYLDKRSTMLIPALPLLPEDKAAQWVYKYLDQVQRSRATAKKIGLAGATLTLLGLALQLATILFS